MNLLECLLHYYHCENGCSSRYISGPYCYAVCSNHSGSCIAFRWTEWNTCFKILLCIKECCTLLCKCTFIFTCNKYTWNDILKLPCNTLSSENIIELVVLLPLVPVIPIVLSR